MEIFSLAYITLVGLLIAFADLMSLAVNWILLLVFMLFGCFTVGNINDHLNKIYNVSEEDRLFYGKVKIKYPFIRVTLNSGVHPIVVVWATMFYLLSYSLLHKYGLTDFSLLLGCVGLAFASALFNWFRLNYKYAVSYSQLLHDFFYSRTKVDVKLVTAIRYMLNELYAKLAPEFSKFCSCHPYLDSSSALELQLREVLDQDKNKYIDYLGLRHDLSLDIAEFISGQKLRIRSFLNEKFIGLWPEKANKNLCFDVLFIKHKNNYEDYDYDDNEKIPEVITPMIVMTQSDLDFNKLYGADSVARKPFLTLEEADNLRRELLKLNIHCIILIENVGFKTPYRERTTDIEAINALTENLRTALTLKPKDNKWFIANFFISWPFYLLNFLTFQMISKILDKLKGIAAIALTHISKAAVKDL